MARDSLKVCVSVALLPALTFYDYAVLDVECRGETTRDGHVGEALGQIRGGGCKSGTNLDAAKGVLQTG